VPRAGLFRTERRPRATYWMHMHDAPSGPVHDSGHAVSFLCIALLLGSFFGIVMLIDVSSEPLLKTLFGAVHQMVWGVVLLGAYYVDHRAWLFRAVLNNLVKRYGVWGSRIALGFGALLLLGGMLRVLLAAFG
jgi:hypothetical protein